MAGDGRRSLYEFMQKRTNDRSCDYDVVFRSIPTVKASLSAV